MDLGISGRLAVVSGASQGIGHAIALSLAAEGVDLILAARSEDRLASTAEEIAALGRRATIVPTNLTTLSGCEAVAEAAQAAGGADILVNNAGGTPWGGFGEFSDDEWDSGIDLKPRSYLRLSRLLMGHMQQQKWGRIINIGGLEAKTAWPAYNLGMVSASMITAFTKSLSDELAPDGVLVTAVHPGVVDTPRVDKFIEHHNRSEGQMLDRAAIQSQVAAACPLGRLADPSEVADVVAFLASERAGFITGTSIVVDGGESRAVH